MVAVEWSNLGYAGAFIVGTLTGVLLTIRLSKVLAGYLTAIRRDDADTPAPPPPGE